ncbi:MAG: glutathione S-transferase N-terminal domain-containing protein [Rhodanobacteraceae bacterium]|nr:glutathione S-transferase N-terminal domain-containing protein [Rhodanobacteraceae bacterium]MBK7044356.1 glutathione S-transferase N-terminal domain-containing protein [Rhodanobacteraceae bacterium]MBP9154976.1 glutathione S-transferase N-terminal domain-containing protein [Xanthomonadales bacterium]
MTLFSGRDDIDSHRVRLVLAAKAVGYELVVVEPAKPPEDLIELNPYNSVPTLADRELSLYDVDVICEYLDERYPHPPLLPVDPLSRARVRLAVRRIERDWLSQVEAIQNGTKAVAEAARKRLRDGLVATLPAFKVSKFFLNPEMSLADCALAPLIWRLPSLSVQLPKEVQGIIDYGERIFRNPAFTRSMTDTEKQLRP